MISECHAVGLPEPTFEQNGAHFVTTIWRDWLTDAVMDELGLNERQRRAVLHIKQHGAITNAQYQVIADCSPRSALRGLATLVDAGIVLLNGRGRGAVYEYVRKRARNAPNTPQEAPSVVSFIYRTYAQWTPTRTRHEQDIINQ